MFIGSLILFSLASQYVKKEKNTDLKVIEMTIIRQTSKVDECWRAANDDTHVQKV